MKYRIILVPFPFDDLSGSKLRPAICLTNALTSYQHIVIAFITSQVHKATEPSDLPMLTTDPDFIQTGLKVDSAIRLHRVVTVPTRLIQRQLGVLPNLAQINLATKLRGLFDL